MAIVTIQGGSGFYDFNRDMYYSERDRHEREMQYRRLQEEEYRKMYSTIGTLQSTHDPKDPLAFLTKTDNKILLTGEAA